MRLKLKHEYTALLTFFGTAAFLSGATLLRRKLALTKKELSPDFLLSGESIPSLAIVISDTNEYGAYYSLSEKIVGENDQLSPRELDNLKGAGIAPVTASLDRVVSVRSMNDVNKFFIGYSEPLELVTQKGNVIDVIKPEWAVSYGSAFNSENIPLRLIGEREDEFKDVLSRVLLSEWMLTRTRDTGCDPSLDDIVCGAERRAIAGCFIERIYAKGTDIPFEEVIFARRGGLAWNANSKLFEAGYKGYPGEPEMADFPKKSLDPAWLDKFENFYTKQFWQLPNLAYHGTNFIHYNALRNIPRFVTAPQAPFEDFAGTYATEYPIWVGKVVTTDQYRYIR